MLFRSWKKYLPKMYRDLKQSGDLQKALDNAVMNTMEAEHNLFMQLRKQNPPPQTGDFLKAAAHIEQLNRTAWEIVREMWILLPAEENEESPEQEVTM